MMLKSLVADLETIAKSAGRIPMDSYGTVIDISKEAEAGHSLERTQNKSSLTQVDIDTQKYILGQLSKKYAQFGVYSEEETAEIAELEQLFGHRGGLKPNTFTFIIDPIDGTTNFLNTNPANWGKKGDPKNKDKFGIQITVAYGNRIVAGVIHYPALNATISTYESGPTVVNGVERTISQRPFSPANPLRISSSIDFMGSDSDTTGKLFQNKVSFGASCYNLYALLTQEIDAYLVSKIELLDFGITALAYENAGGFLGGLESQRLELSNLINSGKKRINVEGFMLLTPSREYHRDMIDYMKQSKR